MKTAKVYFEDGNTLTTSINGTNKEIEAYYIGKSFQFGDTEEKPNDYMVKAVKVEFLQPFKFSFVGRKSGAIGKTYKINATYQAFNQQEAFNQLYTDFEHITTLCLNGELLSHR
jgi:hypothetical protein